MVLGVSEESVWRHPFPGPGLAIRVLGDLSKERLDILREADAIMIEELHKNGQYRLIGQAFVVLLPVKSVGVMGDGRTYEQVACVRCVQTTDYMTADWYHMPYVGGAVGVVVGGGRGSRLPTTAGLCCAPRSFWMVPTFTPPQRYEVLGIISNRIINEVRGINRVCYDISSKPPATIEWE